MLHRSGFAVLRRAATAGCHSFRKKLPIVMALAIPTRRWMTASPTKKAARAAAKSAAVLLRRLTVALVGCPNVGKSTLFNRLTKTRHAIVNKTAGTTRDWKKGEAQIGDLAFNVIDTGGLDEKDAFGPAMLPRTQDVLVNADVVLFIVDARAGITPDDKYFAQWVRKRRSGPVVVLANKTDGIIDSADGEEAWDVLCGDVHALGLGEPIPVSAEHGDGLVDIHDALFPFAVGETLSESSSAESNGSIVQAEGVAGARGEKDAVISLAIVGRPNVGKSTLLNQLIGENRVITSPVAGTTRDSIRVDWQYQDRKVQLVDTAGITHLGRWDTAALIDSVAVASATKTLSRASVGLLVMDAKMPVTKQDLTLAQKIIDEGRAIVIALNKMDTTDDPKEMTDAVRDRVQRAVWQAAGVHCVPISATLGKGLKNIMPAVVETYDNWSRHVPSRKLNAWFELLQRHHPPPPATKTVYRKLKNGGKTVPVQSHLRVKFITQVGVRPPTFAVFCNRSEIPESYTRFLINSLREEFGFLGTPMRVHVRGPRNPFKKS